MSTILIDRLCEIVAAGEMSRAGLARAAGLHPNSLRKLGDSDWNPTAETLLKLEKFLAGGGAIGMASAEQIIDEARNGRMFILVDDEDRENEGDLVIPRADGDARRDKLHGQTWPGPDLPGARRRGSTSSPAADESDQRHALETAFTASIEAKEGVTTVSAPLTGRTISVAIDAGKGPSISSRRATSSRSRRARAGCWYAPAIPRPR
jgi:3,4-dihydroxy 2-butanone 4-phosphate synthase/GTP cyclohydrolase II